MLALYTAEIFKAFLYGVASTLAGGYLFEHGKGYVKALGGNQFKGKIEGAGVLGGVLFFGWGIQQIDSFVVSIVDLFLPMVRLGIMIVGTMLLYNYITPNYNYDDHKSLFIYFIGVIVAAWPYLSFT